MADQYAHLYWPFHWHTLDPTMLTRTPTQTLTEQLAGRLAERVRSGLLAPGARLPSVRECARQQGVSPHTVVAAYDLLLAQGLVEAQRQRGFFVRDSGPKRPEAGDAERPPATKNIATAAQPLRPLNASPMQATALIRGMFHTPSGRAQPGSA